MCVVKKSVTQEGKRREGEEHGREGGGEEAPAGCRWPGTTYKSDRVCTTEPVQLTRACWDNAGK